MARETPSPTLGQVVRACTAALATHPDFDWATSTVPLPHGYLVETTRAGTPIVWLDERLTGDQAFVALLAAIRELDGDNVVPFQRRGQAEVTPGGHEPHLRPGRASLP